MRLRRKVNPGAGLAQGRPKLPLLPRLTATSDIALRNASGELLNG